MSSVSVHFPQTNLSDSQMNNGKHMLGQKKKWARQKQSTISYKAQSGLSEYFQFCGDRKEQRKPQLRKEQNIKQRHLN